MPEATLSQVNNININGVPFYYVVSEIEMFGVSMRQVLYTTRMSAYLVVFTTTSLQPADDSILREAIMSIVVTNDNGDIHENTNGSGSNDLVLDDPPERSDRETPGTTPDGTIDERLIGTWEWELGDFIYIFNADGTGTRGFPYMELDFVWRVNGDTLYIEIASSSESWAITMERNSLTIVCNDSGATFTYHAR